MKISAARGDLTKTKADLLVVNEFEGVKRPGGPPRVDKRQRVEAGATSAVDTALGGLLTELALEEHFEGELGEALIVHTHGKIPAKRVSVVGLGKQKDFSLETVRRATALSLRKAKQLGAKNVVSIFHGTVPPTGGGGLDASQAAQAMTEGALMADYHFSKYHAKEREKQQKTAMSSFRIVTDDAEKVKKAKAGIERGELFAKATAYARDLVNEPPSRMTPKQLAEHAKKFKVESSKFKIDVEVFGEKQLEKMGAGGILGVSAGSDEEAFLIHLHYQPAARLKSQVQKFKKIALVGKGLTFDSGGLGIKPWDSMITMKMDMAGAAAVLGVFYALKDLQPAIEIHGVIAATENMLGGKAIKPGDVLHTLSGKTVEVLHTDAEGRIVLADALAYANRLKPDAIIDLATLTGAAIAALGELYGAAMSNSAALEAQVKNAAEKAGEPLWPLPLPQDYGDYLKSDVADLANIAKNKGAGGAIAGGLFLKEFVGETPWVHLDIAGPAFLERDFPQIPYAGKGGTGFGVRLLLEYLSS